MHDIPVPNLTTAHSGPLFHVEKVLLNQVSVIEYWFRQQWQKTPPPVTSSVDLRHAGFKLAPVDTNLFPAGFNNLNPDFFSLCIQAAQSVLTDYFPQCKRILLLPESHTRNHFYAESINILKEILIKAGFEVRLGSLQPPYNIAWEMHTVAGASLQIEPLILNGNRIILKDFDPCLLILNNDLSAGIPAILQQCEQRILPTAKLGWSNRLKSTHFYHYNEVVEEFAGILNLDPWFICPYYQAIDSVDFMSQEGLDILAIAAENILEKIAIKYKQYGIEDRPFVVVKADNGTYGMSVMMVQQGAQLKQLNRKQRTKMAASKGSQKVNKVIIQEGVYTFETMPNHAVAEPVVYMIGSYVVGGFYRVHQERGVDENLNAPGMHFEPLAFAQACNMPSNELPPLERPNRFYAYGVIARLAALAAAREIKAVGE